MLSAMKNLITNREVHCIGKMMCYVEGLAGGAGPLNSCDPANGTGPLG
jgi:hypothetical protein